MKLFATPKKKKPRHREQEALNKARTEKYDYQGTPIQLYSWGSGTKTALLVHGWESNAGSLGAFVNPLVGKGYQVWAFDGPAHGKSGGSQTHLFHFAGLLTVLMQRLAPQVLITHSFGTGSSVYALYANPQIHIRKLVMLTTPNHMDDIFSDFTRLMKIKAKGKAGIYDHLYSLFGTRVEEMSVSQMIRECNIQDLLIIHSPSDKVLPFQCAREVAAARPEAILEKPASPGHYRLLWDPATLKSVNQFIDE